MAWTRASVLGPAMEQLLAGLDFSRHVAQDPVRFPRCYREPLDQELVGLFAAALAYGRQDLFGKRLEEALAALGPSPSLLCASLAPRELLARFPGDWLYRMTGPRDAAALLSAAARVQKAHGSLGALFARRFREAGGDVRAAASAWRADLIAAVDTRALYGSALVPRRLKHLLPDPAGPGAAKRLHLYLRWMVRGPDAVDLGLWREVPASALWIPLDTHVARIAWFLGLTRRRSLSFITARQITDNLRRLDPADPVKYDFALCHMGISGQCPSRRDPVKCQGCPIRHVCRMWR